LSSLVPIGEYDLPRLVILGLEGIGLPLL
jgi:hypothetical protein